MHDNADLSNNEEEVTSTEPETKPIATPELEPGPEGEVISPCDRREWSRRGSHRRSNERTRRTNTFA
jgi:hypothetical protein